MATSIAPRDPVTATLFAGYLASIERDPTRWRWPDSTLAYLHHRIDALAAALVTDAAVCEVA